MPKKLVHELRDPIHGLIRVTDQELQVINTRAMQRLRRIKQLAMADLVYPGAVHTRFEHSIGTLHLAQRILDRLRERGVKITQEDERIVRLSSLLHDVGHGPFSHVAEDLLEEHYKPSEVGTAAARDKIHEKITVDIVAKWSGFDCLLSFEERKRIHRIIEGSHERDFLRDIVSSNLDADKMDYLLRDGHYAGVQYGMFDIEKVIDSCMMHESSGQSYLHVEEAGVFAVEQLVIAKWHMTQQVYAHRVRVISDSMIGRGLRLAIEEGISGIKEIFTYDGKPEFIQYYLQFDDERLMSRILDHNNKTKSPAASIFHRLRDRKLFKELALIPLVSNNFSNDHHLDRLQNITGDELRQLETVIAREIKCEPWEVIVIRKSVKNPLYEDPVVLDPEQIFVLMRDGGVKRIGELTHLMKAEIPADQRLHIIGPREQLGEIGAKRKYRNKENLRDKVKSIVGEFIERGA